MTTREPFALTSGALIQIPEGDLRVRRSLNADSNPDTPLVYSLRSASKAGEYFFRREYRGDAFERSLKLFAPAGLKEGNFVVVVWVDETCAWIAYNPSVYKTKCGVGI